MNHETGFSDPADYNSASEFSHPEDEIEPINETNEYREAAQKFLGIVVGCIQFLRDARSPGEAAMRLDIVSIVFNHPAVSSFSLADVGRKHNKTRAAISAQILNFQRANGLPPTLAQKSTKSRTSYSQTRIKNLAKV